MRLKLKIWSCVTKASLQWGTRAIIIIMTSSLLSLVVAAKKYIIATRTLYRCKMFVCDEALHIRRPQAHNSREKLYLCRRKSIGGGHFFAATKPARVLAAKSIRSHKRASVVCDEK